MKNKNNVNFLGLKRGEVILHSYCNEWKIYANDTIIELKDILGDIIKGIEHVGSTAIIGISSKPIIDIAIGVNELSDIYKYFTVLNNYGFVHKQENDNEDQIFLSCGDFENDIRTHHIHVVIYKGTVRNNYINFRDLLNNDQTKKNEYEHLKLELEKKYGNDRKAYTSSKDGFIQKILNQSQMSDLIYEFNKIRDIPYSIPLDLESDNNSCSGKCIKLKKIFEKHGYIVNYRVCKFNWNDLSLPVNLLNTFHINESLHVYLEIMIKGTVIKIDPTWDIGLKDIFPISERNGSDDTIIAVKPLELFDYKESERIMEDSNVDENLSDLEINGKFYKEFNNRLESCRSK